MSSIQDVAGTAHLVDAVDTNDSYPGSWGYLANKVPVHNEGHVLRQLSCGHLLWPFLHPFIYAVQACLSKESCGKS